MPAYAATPCYADATLDAAAPMLPRYMLIADVITIFCRRYARFSLLLSFTTYAMIFRVRLICRFSILRYGFRCCHASAALAFAYAMIYVIRHMLMSKR